ncbi:uncharacterized protein LOC144062359 isoform X2 [Vanacampus margaritifer]
MAQGETMDFKALKAKFQEEELLLTQPRMKPALPEKPKAVPPPTSPTHYLPAGARPTLLTSINQSLDGRMAPRVVFKDEKESRKPLIKTTSMDRNEGKLKKDKLTKGNMEPLDENSLYQKLKKDGAKEKKPQLVTTGDLVSATAQSEVLNSTKKGFLGLKWSAKTNLDEVPIDPILDTPTLDGPVLAPLIPIPPEFDDDEPESGILPPNFLFSRDSDVAMPISPGLTPPPNFIPDIPESETPSERGTPTLLMSILDRQTLQPSIYHTISVPPPGFSSPMPSSPEPDYRASGGVSPISIEAMLKSQQPVEDVSASLPADGSLSALSALERAEDMSQVRKTTAADQRILDALQKARSSQTNSSVSSTPPPEDLQLPQSPSAMLANISTFDYSSRARQHNSINHGQVSPTFDGTNKEGTEDVPALLDVLPPRPNNVLPDQTTLGTPPKKPVKPSAIKSPKFGPPPPPVKHNAIPVPSKLPEMPSTNGPQFGGVTLDPASPEMVVSQWGNGGYTGPDIPDGKNLQPVYSNGVMLNGPKGLPTLGNKLPDQQPTYQADFPIPTSLDGQTLAGNQAYGNAGFHSAKKKAKTEVGRKKKGPPKNPYAEATREIKEGNNTTGRVGKGDKKSNFMAEMLDDKELKKREKQRLEKEKKELKEKLEREKKEQKEREKHENEIRKKFKITGSEEAMYQATVTVTTKGRKDDLPVRSGDNISVIRTTNCPKGKWLARDFANNYGYVAVDHVELDIKEMLGLGRKTSSIRVSSPVEADIIMPGRRTSNHYPLSAESFSDDSEEWAADDDETMDSAYPQAPLSHNHNFSVPNMGNADLNVTHHQNRSDISAGDPNVQVKNEALQKLATFFHSPKTMQPSASTEPQTRRVLGSQHAVHWPQAVDFEHPDSLIIPPPDLYADQ